MNGRRFEVCHNTWHGPRPARVTPAVAYGLAAVLVFVFVVAVPILAALLVCP